MKTLTHGSIEGLRVKTLGDHQYHLTRAGIPDETWSIYGDGDGYEAACGRHGLGRHRDPFGALMAVLGDMGRRAAGVS